jgi:predicted GNAT family acetyltransferase
VTVEVVHDETEHRYELRSDGTLLGLIDYRPEPGAVALVHTEIDPRFERQGLGTQLVAGALADLRARGLRVIPVCPFVADYLRRHPEARVPPAD